MIGGQYDEREMSDPPIPFAYLNRRLIQVVTNQLLRFLGSPDHSDVLLIPVTSRGFPRPFIFGSPLLGNVLWLYALSQYIYLWIPSASVPT